MDSSTFIHSPHRHRVLQALADAIAEHGYANTTVAHVVSKAAISRRTFYEQFREKDEALIALYVDGCRRLLGELEAARRPGQPWPQQVRAGMQVYLDFLMSNASLLRTLFVDIMGLGDAGMQARRSSHQALIDHWLYVINDGAPAPRLSKVSAFVVVTTVHEWVLCLVERKRTEPEHWAHIPEQAVQLFKCLVSCGHGQAD